MSTETTTRGSFGALAVDEPYTGVLRRTFTSQRATVTEYTFEPGAEFPLHRHGQEQITLIERGSVEPIGADAPGALETQDYWVVPADVPHGLRAGPEGARVLAIVVPPRERADAYEVIDGAGTAS